MAPENFALAAAGLGLATALAATLGLRQRAPAGDRLQAVAGEIRAGALTYLRAHLLRLALFALPAAGLLAAGFTLPVAAVFLCGVAASAAAGVTGMNAATLANVRTTRAAAGGGLPHAFATALQGALPLGASVAALGLGGVALLLPLAAGRPALLWAFALGASFSALFARVGGGIYTKAADMGADLVGKVEQGIPEDDPRNPGVIADNVGDNVGDVAGMGADLFESNVGSLVAAVSIATISAGTAAGRPGDALLVAALGLLASLLALAAARLHRRLPVYRAAAAIEATGHGLFLLLLGLAAWLAGLAPGLLVPVLSGNLAGLLIGRASTWYTSGRAVRRVAEAARTGPATGIITGVALGLESVALPMLLVAGAILAAHAAAGVYGIALAGVGMLGTVGLMATLDTSGPIADNAGGLAEMTAQAPAVRAVTDQLDALGNSTAANGKGFAIGSSALTALALFFTFELSLRAAGARVDFSLGRPEVLAGALVGAAVVALCAALTLRAVGAAAALMVAEIRRQFACIPGLAEGRARPDTLRCVRISTRAALDRMLGPALLALAAPPLTGFALGPPALAGLLLGSLCTGMLLAVFMAHAGGVWDNAKKLIESGGLPGAARGDAVHAAAVIADTVGDPFKDTTGPSMNILVKLLAMVCLMVAPLVA